MNKIKKLNLMYQNKIKVKFNVAKVILKGLLQCDARF